MCVCVCVCVCVFVCVCVCHVHLATEKLQSVGRKCFGQEPGTDILMPSLKAIHTTPNHLLVLEAHRRSSIFTSFSHCLLIDIMHDGLTGSVTHMHACVSH